LKVSRTGGGGVPCNPRARRSKPKMAALIFWRPIQDACRVTMVEPPVSYLESPTVPAAAVQTRRLDCDCWLSFFGLRRTLYIRPPSTLLHYFRRTATIMARKKATSDELGARSEANCYRRRVLGTVRKTALNALPRATTRTKGQEWSVNLRFPDHSEDICSIVTNWCVPDRGRAGKKTAVGTVAVNKHKDKSKKDQDAALDHYIRQGSVVYTLKWSILKWNLNWHYLLMKEKCRSTRPYYRGGLLPLLCSRG
jgi:hypothetical protein